MVHEHDKPNKQRNPRRQRVSLFFQFLILIKLQVEKKLEQDIMVINLAQWIIDG